MKGRKYTMKTGFNWKRKLLSLLLLFCLLTGLAGSGTMAHAYNAGQYEVVGG